MGNVYCGLYVYWELLEPATWRPSRSPSWSERAIEMHCTSSISNMGWGWNRGLHVVA